MPKDPTFQSDCPEEQMKSTLAAVFSSLHASSVLGVATFPINATPPSSLKRDVPVFSAQTRRTF
eukprot:scaffold2198_cov273-Pinguiococcus_pyrenoidosus.AAC.2